MGLKYEKPVIRTYSEAEVLKENERLLRDHREHAHKKHTTANSGTCKSGN